MPVPGDLLVVTSGFVWRIASGFVDGHRIDVQTVDLYDNSELGVVINVPVLGFINIMVLVAGVVGFIDVNWMASRVRILES